MTMLAIRSCFDLIPIELIFVGTGGYATEHTAFALGRIVQYATGLNEDAFGLVMEQGTIASEMICPAYGTLCCLLVLFMEFYVLREKTLLSNERRITFSCMVDGEAIVFMSPADIYALMGNALNNALERVVQEPEDRRIVSLLIKRTGEMVLIHLENQCSTQPEFQDGSPAASSRWACSWPRRSWRSSCRA